jgi:hypothetical protein
MSEAVLAAVDERHVGAGRLAQHVADQVAQVGLARAHDGEPAVQVGPRLGDDLQVEWG